MKIKVIIHPFFQAAYKAYMAEKNVVKQPKKGCAEQNKQTITIVDIVKGL